MFKLAMKEGFLSDELRFFRAQSFGKREDIC